MQIKDEVLAELMGEHAARDQMERDHKLEGARNMRQSRRQQAA